MNITETNRNIAELKDRFVQYGQLEESVVYPVKSMAGVFLREVVVGVYGLAGDRRRVFSKVGGEASKANNAKAHLTNRDRHMNEMLLYQPEFLDPDHMDTSDIEITIPEGDRYRFDDDALRNLLEEKSGFKLVRRYYKGGFPDNHRISIIGLPSVRRLERELNIPINAHRFRANFYINFPDNFFLEENTAGLLIKIGTGEQSPVIAVQRADDRCMMVNIDPTSGEVDPRILKQIAQHHDNVIGIYGEVFRPGIARVDDPVSILKLSF